jgi:hypothetical protein
MPLRTAGAKALSLDLSRLGQAAARLGIEPAAGSGIRERLRGLNRAFGERLASGGAGARPALAAAMVEADAALPVEVRSRAGPVATADIDRLRQDGCLELPSIGSAQAAAAAEHLSARALRLGRVPRPGNAQVASLAEVPRDANFACYDPLDLWSSPHLLEFATRDALLDLVQDYLGCTPTLCVFNAYWALPERPADPALQLFHRELDDGRSLAVFTLLTPVAEAADGAHFYVEASHDPARLEASLRAEGVGTRLDYLLAGPFVAPMTMRLFNRSARRFTGPAGASVCADAFGLHRSLVPRSHPKLLLELRFGTFFNESLYELKAAPDSGRPGLRRWLSGLGRRNRSRAILRRLPATSRHTYIFRYLIDALSGGG